MAQNQALAKILDNQQKLAKVVTHNFSSLGSLIDDFKKKKSRWLNKSLQQLFPQLKICLFLSLL